jgi:hypothetical protein
MTLTKAQKAEREEAAEDLRKMLPPGSTIHTVLRHVSRSGMARRIDLYFLEAGMPHWLSYRAAKAIGARFKDEAIHVTGCGMDMGFHLVYALSRVLYPDGHGCIGEGCPSNDHSNGDRDYTPTHWHKDGGYALRHRWI